MCVCVETYRPTRLRAAVSRYSSKRRRLVAQVPSDGAGRAAVSAERDVGRGGGGSGGGGGGGMWGVSVGGTGVRCGCESQASSTSGMPPPNW